MRSVFSVAHTMRMCESFADYDKQAWGAYEAFESYRTNPEVVGFFTVQEQPVGDAPARIKDSWIGASVPVLGENPPHSIEKETGEPTIWVNGAVAIDSLRFLNRTEAAKYWFNALKLLDFSSNLLFLMREGTFLSKQELFPGSPAREPDIS